MKLSENNLIFMLDLSHGFPICDNHGAPGASTVGTKRQVTAAICTHHFFFEEESGEK